MNIFKYFAKGSKGHLFGKQRLWGSIGVGISTVLAGYLVDILSTSTIIKDYSILIYLMAFHTAMNILCTIQFKVVSIILPNWKMPKNYIICKYFPHRTIMKNHRRI